MSTPDVIFPRLGIEIQHLNRIAFNINGWEMYWYGLFITLGFLLGAVAAFRNTKYNGISNDLFIDFVLFLIPISMIFTRLYYVVFNFDVYKDDLLKIFAVRDGGMGVYGGIISGFITCIVFAKIRKVKAGAIADSAVFGLLTGQFIGRLGNLVNQEAFGDYTNNLFAMQYKLDNVSRLHVTAKMTDNLVLRGGAAYIQVHPTFFYEMMLNLAIFILLQIYKKHKRFQGELLAYYVMFYSLGRFFIENLRTDQLFFWNTGIPISMLVSGGAFLAAAVYLIFNYVKVSNGTKQAKDNV